MLRPEQEIMPYESFNPSGRSALVLAPHPDDETIGCGGSLAIHCEANDPVKVVVLTNGAKGDMAGDADTGSYVKARKEEALEACNILGVKDVEFWDYEDRALSQEGHLPQRLAELIRGMRPGFVYMPSPLEFHPDHRAASFFGCEAVRLSKVDCEIIFCEIGQPLVVNTLVDITPVLEKKEKALMCYKSQLKERPYNDMSISLNRFRALTLSGNVTHAEGFYKVSSREVLQNFHFTIINHLIKRMFIDYKELGGKGIKSLIYLKLLLKSLL